MANRLDLDFSIESAEDRNRFLNEYLQEPQFKQKPLTEAELDTCAKYLLYGKDEDGTSCVQRGEVQVDTKNKTWSKEGKIVSLEALLDKDNENGGGNYEDIVVAPHQTLYKNIRETFSREEALKKAPESLKSTFINLFRQIDETELVINFYEINVGKRDKPPRDELIEKFNVVEVQKCKENAALLTQYQYLKKKHLLVDLRRQQYTLRDSFKTTLQRDWSKRGAPIVEDKTLTFDSDMPVFPLGVSNNRKLSQSIFQSFNQLVPNNFESEQLKQISKFYWNKQKERKNCKLFIDFCNLEHVYQLLLSYQDLRSVADLEDDVNSTTAELLNTLDYYIEMANLTDAQKEILDLKIKGVKNKDIRQIVNSKYNKTYNENYISTIFRQKIIKQINETAEFHEQIISNIFFPEEFKKCTSCGQVYLICPQNFIRKSRSKDGFTNRCKKCDKKSREER